MGFPDFGAGTTYDGPALFISGELSDYVKPDYHQVIYGLFPKAKLMQLPQAGHWLHADQPKAFIDAIRQFIKIA